MADTANNADNATDKLQARELPSQVNSAELLDEHRRVNGSVVRTRFPPEPNGYLHVGHAKSMNMNFELAFEKLGVPKENRETIFRYDDTNPEAESKEYIDSLREDVAWMGWKPVRVTYTSDYFDKLYELAVDLIKRDKAYVCHQSKADIEASREIARAKIADPNAPGDPCSPWRNRPIEESLREFENMRKGKYDANAATLRLKMDMYSPNPNMWDQVAYRIKYMPHPHAGDKWCIYPTYDYTHCIIDSLEHIDYSICTLEFETRRESYYWVLEALDLYRPKVYEMSRLNISYTVLSKRKLLKLVMNGYMRGWDDPRMPTIKGLRRRGYSAKIMNTFCNEIGVTRNFNTVQYERLAAVARSVLHDSAPRVMGILQPVVLHLTNWTEVTGLAVDAAKILNVPNFPFDASRGTHEVPFTHEVYIDRSDIRLVDSDDFYGFAPNKTVALKYTGYRVHVERIEVDEATNTVKEVFAILLKEDEHPEWKAKTTVQWVSVAQAVPVEVRMYNHLFVTEEPNDATWEQELNPASEIVMKDAKVDPSIWSTLFSGAIDPVEGEALRHVQFERIGFFVVDKDTNVADKKVVMNLTVNLKDSKPVSETTSDATASGEPANKSRKEEQARQLAEKKARMSIPAEEFFRRQTDLYSAWDAEGVPTHDAAGEKLSKSAYKKLKKDWEKQKQLYDSNNKTA